MGGRWGNFQIDLMLQIAGLLKRHGFKLKRSEQKFYLKKPAITDTLHLSFIPHGEVDFDVTADVAIRFDEVEELANPGRLTNSVGVELGTLLGTGQRRWTISSPPDVLTTASQIFDTFELVGLEFFSRLSTKEALFATLIRNDAASQIVMPFHSERWRKIIALAWLLGFHADLVRLIAEGEAFLRERGDAGLDRFLELAIRLCPPP